MPRYIISDVHEWIKKIPTVPIYPLANPQPKTGSAESVRKEDPIQFDPNLAL